jgi:hypothetical protein
LKLKKLFKGWTGDVLYIVLGFIFAYLFYQGLGLALSTDLPVVAVVSSSMEHDDSVGQDHYKWLEENLGYNRSYIASWPISNGFLVGDLPVVIGTDRYQVGDVIVYSIPYAPAPIIHRIIKINDDGTFQTKGDNNPHQLFYETAIKKEQIHGKVIFIIPKLGYFKVFANVLWNALKGVIGI